MTRVPVNVANNPRTILHRRFAGLGALHLELELRIGKLDQGLHETAIITARLQRHPNRLKQLVRFPKISAPQIDQPCAKGLRLRQLRGAHALVHGRSEVLKSSLRMAGRLSWNIGVLRHISDLFAQNPTPGTCREASNVAQKRVRSFNTRSGRS